MTRDAGAFPLIMEESHGFMIGVELVADRNTKEPLSQDKCGEVAMKLLNAGTIVTPCGRYGNVFRFMPAISIPRDYAIKASETMVDILRNS